MPITRPICAGSDTTWTRFGRSPAPVRVRSATSWGWFATSGTGSCRFDGEAIQKSPASTAATSTTPPMIALRRRRRERRTSSCSACQAAKSPASVVGAPYAYAAGPTACVGPVWFM